MAGAEGFLPSPTTAREYCDASSEQHDAAGLYFSWVLHTTAPHAGISRSMAEARLAEAARLGWSAAQIDYALVLAPDARASIEAQAEAGRLWLAAAERGDPRGQYHYARWLRDSPAGPRDPTAAVPFLERAATRSQPEALHMLATLYRDGVGVARDTGRARALYEQAARSGHPPSLFNLADMLRHGSREDRARAIEIYGRLACMRDELQIQPLALQRLRARGEVRPAC
jgi:TPR repeat protein